jgi:arsenite methyltransferase
MSVSAAEAEHRRHQMPLPCPIDLDTWRLRREIQHIYGRVADAPTGPFHFHRGPEYAAERLGYDAAELATLRSRGSRLR